MSTTTIAEAVREARSTGEPIRTSGRGAWMSAGRPVEAPRSLSLANETGVVDYVPDDLTITVRAGTTLEELGAATLPNNQWLPLDPPGGMTSTIGATIATASSGPLSHSFGFARDLILGLEFVTGKGDVVRSGGRVVKNVAGFDMMRLMCGAWGTLGVITQATLRLYALPKVDRTFALALPDSMESLENFMAELARAPIAPLALEVVSGSLATMLGLPRRATALVRLGGGATLVDAQIKTLSSLGDHSEADANVWASLSSAHSGAHSYSIRLSSLPSKIGRTWSLAQEIAGWDESAFFHSTVSRGITRVVGSFDSASAFPRSDANRRVSYEVLPAAAWGTLSPSVVSDPLSVNVKRAFDPSFILNPGILG